MHINVKMRHSLVRDSSARIDISAAMRNLSIEPEIIRRYI